MPTKREKQLLTKQLQELNSFKRRRADLEKAAVAFTLAVPHLFWFVAEVQGGRKEREGNALSPRNAATLAG